MNQQVITIEEAFRHCEQIATRHYENFPVGSILIPKASRKYFYALYAFMRTADDFADLPSSGTSEERVEKLRRWRQNLEDIYNNIPPTHPVFIALAETIFKYGFDKSLFIRLLDAFEFDAKGDVSFKTDADFRHYTYGSADPVGELVLALFAYSEPTFINLSNEICSGLQLLNFIQDLQEDVKSKRYYLPLDACRRFGLEHSDIVRGKKEVNELVLYQTEKTEYMLDKGAPLAELVSGRLRFELRAVIFGARRMIKKIRAQGGDVLSHRPKLSKIDHVFILIKSLLVKAA
jgi:hydroxysqualene synthase